METKATPFSELVVGCGDRLAAIRLALGFERQTAFAASIGISTQRLNQWEQEKHPPDLHVMCALKRRHGVSLDWIYMADPGAMSLNLVQALVSLGARPGAPLSARRLRHTLGHDPDEPRPAFLHEDQAGRPGFREEQAPAPLPRARRGRPPKARPED
ncbi:helix-turn-helix domain-containing protein [Falsiroseomonas selenitidurans]|uniref:Helix-turn-helix transcriptional regulator n=1 Tax=Falsiroseomonas selenitidurans TaxID=2716335 RepID=A0ABX1EC74_9PROT|nr:helix-turn-helix transcriptional regulator [Falsiroseomonas selenitidurans]NKC33477.1 helix-turn-helix transcriptional regulator [Falsiroseomonas selenitidurans]